MMRIARGSGLVMKLRITRRRAILGFVLAIATGLVVAEAFVLCPEVRLCSASLAEWMAADRYLVWLLSDENIRVRSAAVDVLTRRGGAAVEPLAGKLDSAITADRASAALVLGQIGLPADDAFSKLRNKAEADESEIVRERAALAMGLIAKDNPERIAELIEILRSGDDPARMAAVRGLSRVEESGAPAVPELIRTLENTNPRIRAKAAEALGEIGFSAKSALPALIAALADPDPSVRSEAREATERISRRLSDRETKAQAQAALNEYRLRTFPKQP